MAISKLAIIKFAELLLTIICIALHYNSFHGGTVEEQMLVTGTFCGFIILLVGGFAGHLMSTPIHKRIDIFYCIIGCALFVASGAITIKIWDGSSTIFGSQTRDIALSKGAMAIITGAVFLLDAFFTFRG